MSNANESLLASEAECAVGRVAPRVSLADIENAIHYAFYATGDELVPLDLAYDGGFALSATECLTICLIVMKNGFTFIGHSCPASPENFDPALGRKLAYENAVRQIWPAMGFALKDSLSKEK